MLACDKKNHTFNIAVYVILSLFLIIIFVPLIFVIVNSISNPDLVSNGEVGLFPKSIDFSAYKIVLGNEQVRRGFLNSILYTIGGTALSIVITITSAYALSRKDFAYKKILTVFFLVTMFISGGMIPTLIIVKDLGLINNPLALILPSCFSVWNMIVCKNYIEINVPWDVIESSKMDGANDFYIFFKIVLPMCVPIIITMILFYGIGYWNSYFNSILYLTADHQELFPLQRVLYEIIEKNDISIFNVGGDSEFQGSIKKSIQYVSIVVSTLPILLVYPFIAKYMEKSVSVGSVKG